jgi:transketolase
LDIVVPVDEDETVKAVKWAASAKRPMYLRVGRHKVPNVTNATTPFELGKWQTLREGNDATIIATGSQVSRALAAAAVLAESGIKARVLNATFIAPLDVAAIKAAATQTKAIVTVEEANIAGGLGAAVASVLVQTSGAHVPMRIIGNDAWAPTLSTDGLYEHFGLTAENITAKVREVLQSA